MLEESAAGGVKVEALQDGGSAAETGLLKRGDRILTILEDDVSSSDFDAVMSMLVEAPEEVTLTVERNVIVKKPKVVLPDPILTVKGGPSGDVARGSSLRLTLLDADVELYKGMKKLTNCGGAGQCNLCMVEVLEGMENLSPPTAVEQTRLKKKPEGYRMACQTLINGDVTVEVPA
uniref:PDZ domain-containing protein n=1 Tax=Prymnesium polylepis TaxID=72548 RepID=A0A7S4I299_9EUKA|mmetsp:Transcript_25472/g.63125  ORF Transcript_25472/g.63125 Transcript_25472/m.63125 type:complete len:176 (+) Transcript_25472:237-764(+)